MREQLITRTEDGFDSIAWAFTEHLALPDTGIFNSAVLYGNEDAPEMIDFYVSAQPLVTDKWFRWMPKTNS